MKLRSLTPLGRDVLALCSEVAAFLFPDQGDANLNDEIVVITPHTTMRNDFGEESVGIPFLISYPDKVKAKREKALFNSIDAMPTILGIMNLPIPDTVDGTDFSKLLKGEKMKVPESAFLSFDRGGPEGRDRAWRAVRTDRYTYCLAKIKKYAKTDPLKDGYVLYDNQKDPYQMNPIFKGMGYDDTIDHLHSLLVEHLKTTDDNFITEQWKS